VKRRDAAAAWLAVLLVVLVLGVLAYLELADDGSTAGRGGAAAHAVVVSEVMADPRAVPDEVGEWFEVHNAGGEAVELRGWTIASANDRPHEIARRVTLPPGGYAVLAREADPARNGGVQAAYAYGATITLSNSSDWLALRDPAGRTADSVHWSGSPATGAAHARIGAEAGGSEIRGPGWRVATEPYGAGDRGTPGRGEPGGAPAREPGSTVPAPGTPRPSADAPAPAAPGTFTSGSGAVYRDHLEFGAPRGGEARGEILLRKPEFVVSYSPARGGPGWVAWNVNATHFGDAPRSNRFLADPDLPAGVRRVVATDYTSSGYSRGHMVRSEERTRSAAENAATFLMTNVLPQHQDLNGGPWLQLEQHVQRLAQREGRELYIYAGGLYPPGAPTLKDEGRVAVPSHTWKIVLVLRAGQGVTDVRAAGDVEVIAVSMPNVAGIAAQPWARYRTSVAELERATGYRFLGALPDPVAEELRRRR
jgi:endonuclease G, mitochondrial